MSGLLRKDLYVADRSVRMLLVMALIFSMIPGMETFGSTYSMMLALMVPLTAIAYDEKSKWDRYASMLPYRTEQLVWAKYLLGYLFALLAEGILVLGMVVRSMIRPGSTNWQEFSGLSIMLLAVTFFATALALPALYRFGAEKGRLVSVVMMGLSLGVALGIAGVFGELPLPELPMGAVAGIVAVLAVAVTYASFRLSVYFYKKRQNGVYN